MILQVPGLSSQLGSKLHTLPETNIPLMVHKSCSPVDMEKSLIIYRVFITCQVVFFPDSFHQQQVRTWKWMVGWNTICNFLLGEPIFFRGELATLVSGECNLQLFDFVFFFCFFFRFYPFTKGVGPRKPCACACKPSREVRDPTLVFPALYIEDYTTQILYRELYIRILVGGFKYLLFSLLLGEMIQFD